MKLEMKMFTICDKWMDLPSINRLIKTFRMSIRFLLQHQLLMQNLLHIQAVSVPNKNSKRSATASYTVSKETEVRQKIDDRHAHRDHVKPALADNYSKELDKLFGTDSECGNDYSDISSECDSDFSVQDEDNLDT